MEIPIAEEGSIAPHKESYFFEPIQSPLAKDKEFAERLLKWYFSSDVGASSSR